MNARYFALAEKVKLLVFQVSSVIPSSAITDFLQMSHHPDESSNCFQENTLVFPRGISWESFLNSSKSGGRAMKEEENRMKMLD